MLQVFAFVFNGFAIETGSNPVCPIEKLPCNEEAFFIVNPKELLQVFAFFLYGFSILTGSNIKLLIKNSGRTASPFRRISQ